MLAASTGPASLPARVKAICPRQISWTLLPSRLHVCWVSLLLHVPCGLCPVILATPCSRVGIWATTGPGDAQRALNSTSKPTGPCSLHGLQILADLLIGFFHSLYFNFFFKAESLWWLCGFMLFIQSFFQLKFYG